MSAPGAYAGFDWGNDCEGVSGSFQQQIESWNNDYDKEVAVGEIPSGIENRYIEPTSDFDLDIRLYDKYGTKIIRWEYPCAALMCGGYTHCLNTIMDGKLPYAKVRCLAD